MAFDGFYTGGWWWSGDYSHTKEFNWQNPTTVLAFGALSAISMVGAGSQMGAKQLIRRNIRRNSSGCRG